MSQAGSRSQGFLCGAQKTDCAPHKKYNRLMSNEYFTEPPAAQRVHALGCSAERC
jgi:hypothetical protein